MSPKTDQELIDALETDIKEIREVLYGTKESKGLVHIVADLVKSFEGLRKTAMVFLTAIALEIIVKVLQYAKVLP